MENDGPDEAVDLILVGAGLVGLAAATAFAALGMRIAVVTDRHPGPVADSAPDLGARRAIALSLGSAEILRRLGAQWSPWLEIEGLASPISVVHVTEAGGIGATRLVASELGVPALGYVASAAVIERALARPLTAVSAVRVYAPARVGALQCAGGAVILTLEASSDSHRRGATPVLPRRLRAPLLVAADGGVSGIRTLLGVRADHRDYRQRALIADVGTVNAHGGVAYERFSPEGSLALLPLGPHEMGLVWSGSADYVDELESLSSSPFLRRLEAAAGMRLGGFAAAGPRTSFALHRTRVTRPAMGRIVFVGNAATQLHPVAGQGFNLGLRDVETLAALVGDAWRAGADLGSLGLTARYGRERAGDRRRTVCFTETLVDLFSNRSIALGLARQGALVTLDAVPRLNRAFARRAMGAPLISSAAGPRQP